MHKTAYTFYRIFFYQYMNMIVHNTIRNNININFTFYLINKFQILPFIFIFIKDILFVYSLNHNMIKRHIDMLSWTSCHIFLLTSQDPTKFIPQKHIYIILYSFIKVNYKN